MPLATYKWTHQKYHQAIEQGLFVDEAVAEMLNGFLELSRNRHNDSVKAHIQQPTTNSLSQCT